MIAKTTPPAKSSSAGRPTTAPLSMEERLRDIERLRERVNSYAEFMCRPAGMAGTSQETREKAIAAFHERLATLERDLGRIHENFRLD